MDKTKNKKEDKSYYNIKGKSMEYVQDEKNLNKIRSKNLRNFCRFYRDSEITPIIVGLRNGEEDFMAFHRFSGAYGILANTQQKEMKPELLKKLKEFEKEQKVRLKWVSNRSVYDYMNARKFILACKNIYNEMMMGMLDGIKESHNVTQKNKGVKKK